MTDTERQTAHARTSLAPAPDNAPTAPQTEHVPAYAPDPGNNDALLNTFLDDRGDWEKYRTFPVNQPVEADLTGWRDNQVACVLGPQERADRIPSRTRGDLVKA
ncbi:hypothetical protein AB0O75_31560 [Streptomyces sp. NPDC088921]|uniref:hypothetical protein n=1 Tax=unclassified Streptomyces TaxID=2593676 RepID=UPI00343BC6BE